jgi:hypothetical protein
VLGDPGTEFLRKALAGRPLETMASVEEILPSRHPYEGWEWLRLYLLVYSMIFS